METKQHATEQPGTNEEIKNYLETNENENIPFKNVLSAVKAVLRGKFIAMQAYLKKQEKSQIDNLTLHLKELEKNKQNAK